MTHLDVRAPAAAPIERRRFTLFQDQNGRWVARERSGLIEGVFVSQRDAIRFALFETGTRATCSAVIDTLGRGAGAVIPPADGHETPRPAAAVETR